MPEEVNVAARREGAYPKDICYVVTPFDATLEPLTNTICRAVSDNPRLNLEAKRCDSPSLEIHWHPRLINDLRLARIVVAVCGLDPRTNHPNPNVMYEVGIAHALGKPTLLLFKEGEAIPSDLTSTAYMTFDLAKVSTKEFADTIGTTIRTTLSISKPLGLSYLIFDKQFLERFCYLCNFLLNIIDKVMQMSFQLNILARRTVDVPEKLKADPAITRIKQDAGAYFSTLNILGIHSSIEELVTRSEHEFASLRHICSLQHVDDKEEWTQKYQGSTAVLKNLSKTSNLMSQMVESFASARMTEEAKKEQILSYRDTLLQIEQMPEKVLLPAVKIMSTILEWTGLSRAPGKE